MADQNNSTRYLDEPAGIAAGDNMPRVMPRAMQAQGNNIPREYQRDYARPNTYHNPFTATTKEMGDWSTQSMHSPRAQQVQASREAPVTQGKDYRSLKSDLSDLRTPYWQRELEMRNAGVGHDNPFMAAMMKTAVGNRFGREDAMYTKGILDAYGSTADHRSKVDTLNSADIIKEMESRNALANTGLTAAGYARKDDLNYDIADRAENRLGYQSDRDYNISDRDQAVREGRFGDARKALFAQAAERYGPEFAMSLFGNPFTGGPQGAGIPEMKGSYAAELDAIQEKKAIDRTTAAAEALGKDSAAAILEQNPSTNLARDMQSQVAKDSLNRITDWHSGNELEEYPSNLQLLPYKEPRTGGERIMDLLNRTYNDDNILSSLWRGGMNLMVNTPYESIKSLVTGQPMRGDPESGIFGTRGLGFDERAVQYNDGRLGRLDLSELDTPERRRLLGTMGAYEAPFGR